ncbi:MAG: NAD(P)-dependent glycerol-3-phosphate dehydrogenase [Candidatus Rokubacteria bacterium]|nr:NAD(P)-dependent glycerol-3-phosphate dehydrogenase [Candidatus Rokubacteria bacterium]
MTIGVIGGGSWGTALAMHLRRAGSSVQLWAREPEVVDGIRREGRNPWYLSDVPMPPGIRVTGDLAEAVAGAEMLVIAVPSEFVARTVAAIERIPAGADVVSATKGFDPERHVRMTELVGERFPGVPVAALSGPTFAREVAAGQPTAAVVAAADAALAERVQRRLGTREFRLYTNRDVVGVETGGALKNVIAIATGLADGLDLGQNARAALVTRGLAEMTRLAVALGGHPGTLAGLAGLGDLVLTCTGTLSRNHTLGMELAKGGTLAAFEGGTRMIAEGVRTARSADALAARHAVSLPITREVAAVLFEAKPAREALASLLDRPAAREDR